MLVHPMIGARKAGLVALAIVVGMVGIELVAFGSGGAGPIATIYNGFTVGSGNATITSGTLNFGASGGIKGPDNTTAAVWIGEGSNHYVDFNTTDSGENVTFSQNTTIGPFAAGATFKVTSNNSATASLQIENTSSGTAQLRFLGPDGGNNISLPGGKASGLALDSFGVINLTTWVTTTGAERIVDNVPHYGTLSTVAATGTTQANSTIILPAAVWVTVTAADGTKGVQLPSGSAVHAVRLMSQTASALKVYGNNFDDDTINGGAADAAYSQAAGTSLLYQTANGTAWFTY